MSRPRYKAEIMYQQLKPWLQYAGLAIFCYLTVRSIVRGDEIGGTLYLIAIITQLKIRWNV